MHPNRRHQVIKAVEVEVMEQMEGTAVETIERVVRLLEEEEAKLRMLRNSTPESLWVHYCV
jgi:hypothetical protein